MEEKLNTHDEDKNINTGRGEQDQNENDKQKKLRRSRIDRIFFGVCGGLGEYFNVNPLIFRLFFIASLLVGAWGIVIYIILSFVLPNSSLRADPDYTYSNFTYNKSWTITGTFLILLGIYLLVQDIGILDQFSFFGFRHQVLIPTIIIIAFILFYMQYDIGFNEINQDIPLIRSDKDKVISGVCSSLGRYFNIEVNYIRIIFVLCTILTIGIGIFIYMMFALLVPQEKEGSIAG
jgi:phage shock protein C